MGLAEPALGELGGSGGRLLDGPLTRLVRRPDLPRSATVGVGATQLVAAGDDVVDDVGAAGDEEVHQPRRQRRLGQLGEGGSGRRLAGRLELASPFPTPGDEVFRSAGVQLPGELFCVDRVGHTPTLAAGGQPEEQARQKARYDGYSTSGVIQRAATNSACRRGRLRHGTPMSTWWARCQPVL